MPEAVAETEEVATLHELNRGYVRAAQNSDVKWFADHLHDAYMSFNPDGSLVDKAGFIDRIASPGPARRYEAVDARVRLIGDLGIIQSGFRMLDPEGKPARGCYTDVWSRATGAWLCLSAHFALFDLPMRADAAISPEIASPGTGNERAILEELNSEFIRSVRESDAGWFEANLDPDFLNSNPDGSLSERATFIANIAKPSVVKGLRAEDVRIGIIGNVANIRARTRYTKPGGEPGIGRYTDLWLRRPEGWRCVSAHVTRG
jgi:ketosteroid isomerase-like protein